MLSCRGFETASPEPPGAQRRLARFTEGARTHLLPWECHCWAYSASRGGSGEPPHMKAGQASAPILGIGVKLGSWAYALN